MTPSPDPRPDIVMLMADQHAARVTGCAGDTFAETPAIDRLASQGTAVRQLLLPLRSAFPPAWRS